MAEIGVLLLAFSSATSAGASMERHHEAMFGRALTRPRYWILRCAAWLLAIVSYALAVVTLGPGLGSVEWLCFFGLAGVAVGVALAYRPRLLPAWTIAAVLAGLAAFAAA